ncbi:rRNA cytosine-C5-methyltransferase, partial [Paenibacillus riograndensis]
WVMGEGRGRCAAVFCGCFERSLSDGPGSGEGMCRKDEDMVKQWGPETPLKYAAMQREILASAAAALKPGGTLVYSTCTFATEENEGIIGEFLASHPEFSLIPAGGTGLFPPGSGGLPGAARLWPHKVKGEGHVMAVLRHDGSSASPEEADAGLKLNGRDKALPVSPRNKEGKAQASAKAAAARADGGGSGKGRRAAGKSGGAAPGRQSQELGEEAALVAYSGFAEEQLGWQPAGYPVLFGDHLYLSPLPKAALDGLKTIRPGWYAGHVRSGRFIPGHPLATALHPAECIRSLSLPGNSGEAVSYLKGETLSIPAERLSVRSGSSPKGYVLVCIDGYSAGWGKWQDGMLKNEYPAGWRWT